MFLQNQFFFYRFYFKIMDPMKCIIFTWNPQLKHFEMSRSLFTKRISHAPIALHFLYMCAATHAFLVLKMKGLSTMSLAFHLAILTANWYCLLFRCLHTTKAKDLVSLMNTAILLEKLHFHGKFAQQLNTW